MRTTRTLAILLFLLTLVGGAKANWITVGGNMYADIPGNIGIGKFPPDLPEEKLTVYGGTIKSRNNYYGGKAIYGLSFASGGEATGVYGEATGTGDMVNYGGYFKAAGDWGIGVYGEATSPAAGQLEPSPYWPDCYGGYFQAMGPRGIGVYAKGGALAAHFDGLVKFTLGGGNINMSTPGGWPGIIAFSQNGHRRDITYADWGLSIAVSPSFSPPPHENSITISEAGNVGIGMATLPPYKLSVEGRIALTDVPVWDGTDDNDLTWDGYAIGREGSSRRYKQNIRPFDEDFRNILKLQVKQFQMREGYGNPEKDLFGYIAEDVEEVGLTKLVTHDAEGRPDGIKYKKIAIYLNEIVKEHEQDIAKIKSEFSKLELLKKENAELHDRIKTLESLVGRLTSERSGLHNGL